MNVELGGLDSNIGQVDYLARNIRKRGRWGFETRPGHFYRFTNGPGGRDVDLSFDFQFDANGLFETKWGHLGEPEDQAPA